MKKTFLENAYNDKKLIGIRTNAQDWDESIIGFIMAIEDSLFTINEIDEYGILIGNTVIAIEDVINVEINDRYQKRLKFIYDNSLKLKLNNRITIWKEGAELLPYFKDLIKDEKIITLYFDEDNYVTGMILKNDKDYIMLKNIGCEGDEDGTSIHSIDNLIGLRYDGIEEQKIKMLFDNRASFYEE